MQWHACMLIYLVCCLRRILSPDTANAVKDYHKQTLEPYTKAKSLYNLCQFCQCHKRIDSVRLSGQRRHGARGCTCRGQPQEPSAASQLRLQYTYELNAYISNKVRGVKLWRQSARLKISRVLQVGEVIWFVRAPDATSDGTAVDRNRTFGAELKGL